MNKEKEVVRILNLSAEEIRRLRHSNALLEARLSGFDDALSLLHGKPGEKCRQGEAVCIAWEAEKVAEEIKNEHAKPHKAD